MKKKIDWKALGKEAASSARASRLWKKAETDIISEAAKHGITDGHFLKAKFPDILKHRTPSAISQRIRRDLEHSK